MPNSVAVTPRRVVGGHVVAVVVGGAFSPVAGLPGESTYLVDVMAALSVGLSILVMVSTDTAHPQAAGTALGLVIYGWSPSAVCLRHPLQRDRPIAPQGRAPPQAHKPALSGRRESPERPTLASNGGNPV